MKLSIQCAIFLQGFTFGSSLSKVCLDDRAKEYLVHSTHTTAFKPGFQRIDWLSRDETSALYLNVLTPISDHPFSSYHGSKSVDDFTVAQHPASNSITVRDDRDGWVLDFPAIMSNPERYDGGFSKSVAYSQSAVLLQVRVESGMYDPVAYPTENSLPCSHADTTLAPHLPRSNRNNVACGSIGKGGRHWDDELEDLENELEIYELELAINQRNGWHNDRDKMIRLTMDRDDIEEQIERMKEGKESLEGKHVGRYLECHNIFDSTTADQPWSDFVSCENERPYCDQHSQLQFGCAKMCGTCAMLNGLSGQLSEYQHLNEFEEPVVLTGKFSSMSNEVEADCSNLYDSCSIKPWSDFTSCENENPYCAEHKELRVGCAQTCNTCDEMRNWQNHQPTRNKLREIQEEEQHCGCNMDDDGNDGEYEGGGAGNNGGDADHDDSYRRQSGHQQDVQHSSAAKITATVPLQAKRGGMCYQALTTDFPHCVDYESCNYHCVDVNVPYKGKAQLCASDEPACDVGACARPVPGGKLDTRNGGCRVANRPTQQSQDTDAVANRLTHEVQRDRGKYKMAFEHRQQQRQKKTACKQRSQMKKTYKTQQNKRRGKATGKKRRAAKLKKPRKSRSSDSNKRQNFLKQIGRDLNLR